VTAYRTNNGQKSYAALRLHGEFARLNFPESQFLGGVA
jgi:hypothetical protein